MREKGEGKGVEEGDKKIDKDGDGNERKERGTEQGQESRAWREGRDRRADKEMDPSTCYIQAKVFLWQENCMRMIMMMIMIYVQMCYTKAYGYATWYTM